MTDIHPSPSGYRGQDETPGSISCSPGSFKHTGHVYHAEQSQQPEAVGIHSRKRANQYSSQDDFVDKQRSDPTRGSISGEDEIYGTNGSYRRKSDSGTDRGIANEPESNSRKDNKKSSIAGYNEGYKKNTPGYKNDSGYSESVGFDSFSLPLNERDDASPPPTPPVRDASSLKGVCYGPGHEKYPSWPSAPERHPDDDGHNGSSGHSGGSHRSKSWTDHTNYPKEKPAQYTRPLVKRPNPTFTQQLKTVMERCEKISPESFESRGSRGNATHGESRSWPRVDREGKPLGDAEYVVPSPPEREQQQPSQTISHAELEAYVRSYQAPQISQGDIYEETGLTKAGLEEYTRIQHSHQPSYAHSEGYHSYVSSVDSTTNTPFLDRLRRDSEAVAQRSVPSWDEASREGRDSVVTTSSGGSASSSETLKWHGSMSDVSVSSGLPARQSSIDRWERNSMSDVSSVNGIGSSIAQDRERNGENMWQQSMMSDLRSSTLSPPEHDRRSISNTSNVSDVDEGTRDRDGNTTNITNNDNNNIIDNNNESNNHNHNNNNNNNNHHENNHNKHKKNNSNSTKKLDNDNNKWKQETNGKWQASMNDRNCKESSSSDGRTSFQGVIDNCGSLSDVCQASLSDERKWEESSIDDETPGRARDSLRNWDDTFGAETGGYDCVTTKTGPHSPTPRAQVHNGPLNTHTPDEMDPLGRSISDVNQVNLPILPGNSNSSNNKQLIAHSARVETPQRHHSESVLYLDRERTQRQNNRMNSSQPQDGNNLSIEFSSQTNSGSSAVSPQNQPHLSVAERISELEKQQHQQQMRYTYLDPDKRHRVSDPTLKAIQKKALLSFYERHQSSWRSEPQLAQGFVPTAQSPPPQPPPRPRGSSSRRASSASDYSSGTWRDKTVGAINPGESPTVKHQHSNSCGSLSMDLMGPVIVGPAISIDDWVPERPPKKPHLRTVYNDRVPSPDLPPPSPPTVMENEVVNCDDPLPPPPPELADGDSNKPSEINDAIEEKRRHKTSHQQIEKRQSIERTKHVKRPERTENPNKSNSNPPNRHRDDVRQQHFVRGASFKHEESLYPIENGVSAGLVTHRLVPTGRSSLRYQSTQKFTINENLPYSGINVSDERRLSSRPPARLPDMIAQRYTDSGNQRPAPQVPVESRIIRRESMRVETTRIDVSGIVKNGIVGTRRFETSSGQRPQPQVPKNNRETDKNVFPTSCQQQTARPNYLGVMSDGHNNSSSKYSEISGNNAFSMASPVKTGYEASSKLLAEASPRKYHEPPKYFAGHHQRHGETDQRYYSALSPQYNDPVKQNHPHCVNDRYGLATATSPASPPPPPLAPRQNIPGRKSLPPPPRPAPPQPRQGSQSKASYLAYRRERGVPDSEGSYKRTMSPTARLSDWQQHHQPHSAGSREHNDAMLLRVTPHHSQQQQQQQQQHPQRHPTGLPKSHSVDALHQRIEDRNFGYSSQVMERLSHKVTKKVQATENHSKNENNNDDGNRINIDDDDVDDVSNVLDHVHKNGKQEYNDRRFPQNVETLNDKNRHLEKERRKFSPCEPADRSRLYSGSELSNNGIEDFYRETSATIEMTSKNVQLVNQKDNALGENNTNERLTDDITGSIKQNDNTNLPSNCDNNIVINENYETISVNCVEEPTTAIVKLPKKSPVTVVTSQESCLITQTVVREPVRRRSGQCSGSGFIEQLSTIELSSRNNDNCANNLSEINDPINKPLRELVQGQTADKLTSERQLSSLGQMDSTSMKLNNQGKSSQTEHSNASMQLERIKICSAPRPRSRSSPLSVASNITTSCSSSSCSSLDSPRYSPINPENSSCVSSQPRMESLATIQRSEIVLKVNAITNDASSQTGIHHEDEWDIGNDDKTMDCQTFIATNRRKLQEEIECEQLSRDLANQLAPNDKLVTILVPVPEHKKPTDYVSGLFRVEATLQARSKRTFSLNASTSAVTMDTENHVDVPTFARSSINEQNETMASAPTNPVPLNDPINPPLSGSSAYFTTSEGKARFLTTYSRDVTDADIISMNSVNSPPIDVTISFNDNHDLRRKKEELVLRLEKKVLILKTEQEAVREEGELNEALGVRVATRVSEIARPTEASKYRLHVEEVGKITSLLLGLSGRLARAENALYGMPADHSERKILESKRDKLMDQLEEAKILKSNIDKRSVNVSAILANYLNDDEYADYQHFINMKAKLIMDGREIQDKVKLGEEQLAALKEAIN